MSIRNAKVTTLKRCDVRIKDEITLEQTLEYIKGESCKKKAEEIRRHPGKDGEEIRKRLKVKNLSAFVFAGLFGDDVKKDGFIESNGLFCVDIDHIGDLEASKRIISSIPSVVSCFVSPSGDGLKAVLRVNPEKVKTGQDFTNLYFYVEDLFKEHNFIIDKARKNVDSLCFASYDPEIYINYDADIFDPVIVDRQSEQREYSVNENGYSQSCIRVIASMLISAPVGSLHCARLAASRTAGGYVAGGLCDESEMRVALIMMSDRISSTGKTTESELKTIEDGFQLGLKEPLYKCGEKVAVVEKIDHDAIWLNGDELAESAEAPNFLINNIIESKTNGLIAGSSQSFKSFFVLKMAHSICTGNDFFGHDVYTTGKVLYICGEGMGALGRRIKALRIVDGDFNGNFFVLNKPLFIDNIAEMEWLRESINKINPVFVIFDTFSSLATNTKENVNEEVARVLRMVSDCCLDVGAGSSVVHHYGKDADKGTRGASAFSANVDYEISLKRTPNTLDAVISCKKSKDGDFFDDIEITARVVDIGLIRQDGGKATSLVLSLSEHGDSLTPRQKMAMEAIRGVMIEEGHFMDGHNGVTEKQIKDCFKVAFAHEGENKYRMFGKLVPALKKKDVLVEKNGFFFIK